MTARNRLIASAITVAILLLLMAGLALSQTGGSIGPAFCAILIAWNLYTGWRAWREMQQ